MTIKISQLSTSTGEILLTLSFDNPKGSGTMQTYTLRKDQLYNILAQVGTLLGRPVTLTDAQQSVVGIVNQIRAGTLLLPINFDFAPYVGVELETS